MNPEGTADLAELNYIKPAFAALIFRHEGLRASEPVSQARLGKACTLPRLNKLTS
jgi:hypothetical protein